MTRYVALLRGINVSGQKLIKMEELRRHLELPGFSNIVTYIQSGNVLFDTKEKKQDLIRKQIEDQLIVKLGYAVPVIVRSLKEIGEAIANNPFDTPVSGGKARLYVSFLSGLPDEELIKLIEAFSYEAEKIKVVNREAYLLTESYGSTKFPNTFIEKKLGVQSTVRNWNTVNKLTEL